jgi:hypothetical protein
MLTANGRPANCVVAALPSGWLVLHMPLGIAVPVLFEPVLLRDSRYKICVAWRMQSV